MAGKPHPVPNKPITQLLYMLPLLTPPEKVLPKFIREGKGNYNPNDVIRIFEMHDKEAQRTIEAHIFINGYDN